MLKVISSELEEEHESELMQDQVGKFTFEGHPWSVKEQVSVIEHQVVLTF